MSGYLLSVVGTVLLSAFVMAIMPSGKISGVIKSIVRLACILAIISPIVQFFTEGNWSLLGEKSQVFFSQSVIEGDNEYIQYYCEMRVRETELRVETEIFEKFGVKTSVQFSWSCQNEEVLNSYEFSGIEIVKISVKAQEKPSVEVLEEMWEYLTRNYCSEVLIE